MNSKRIIEDIRNEIIPEFKDDLDKLSGKTILITGGNGFLASYFVDIFAERNKHLKNPIKMIIINKNSVNEKSRLSHLMNDKNIFFITADVGKPFKVPEGVNIIIHAASRANPKSFLEDPLDTIDANVVGIRTLLEYARVNAVENFLFFSTNEIYGNPLPEFIPTPETYPGNIDCLDERSCYAESKRLAENMCVIFHKKFNVPVKILRILLAYGPGMRDDGKVITDFFAKAIKEKKITFKDKGDSMRSFCYVSDAINAMLKVMFYGKSGEAYNVGNDMENISIRQLAELIAKVINNLIVVEVNDSAIPKQIYGVDNRHPDITKLRNLRFRPKISLEQGLLRLKEYYKEVGLM